MKRWMWLVPAALAMAAVPFAATAQADEKNESEHQHTPTTLDKLPAPARDALVREAGGAQIMDVEQETEHGTTVYEAHVRKGNDVVEIEVDGSGKVLKNESEKGEKEHR